MPDTNDYSMAKQPVAIRDMEWWQKLRSSKFSRLVRFFGTASKTLEEFGDLKNDDDDDDETQDGGGGGIKNISPNLWNAIMSSMSRTEQTQDIFLCELPYQLEATVILLATEAGGEKPTKRRSSSNSTAVVKKRLRNGKNKKKIKVSTAAVVMPKIGSESHAWCVLMSLLAFRVSLLLSHRLEEPKGAWYRIADQAMDLIAPRGFRNIHRTDTSLESLLFSSVLGTKEKRDYNIIRCGAKAVVLCMRRLSETPETSLLYQDQRACLRFSSRFHNLVRPNPNFKTLAPPPADLWVSMEGPLTHGQIVSKIRIDRCSLKQYLATTSGFGVGISTDSSQASFNWYFMANNDKTSLLATLRNVSFLAFHEEFKNDKQNRWMLLQASKAGSYLLGLRKDSDLVIRYAAFVLRLKRFGSRRRKPLGVCKDMPSYLLVFRHVQAVLEKDEKTIPKQHWEAVLRLSLMAIMSWFAKVDRLGKDIHNETRVNASKFNSTNTAGSAINVPKLDSYGFRVLLTQGLSVLFKSALHRQGKGILISLWDNIQRKYNQKRRKRKGEPQEIPVIPVVPSTVDFLDMLNVSFHLGRQKDFLGRRLSAKHDFDIFQQQQQQEAGEAPTIDQDFIETERKASLGKKHGKIYLKKGILLNLHKFLDRTSQGKEMDEAARHQTLFSIIRNGHHSFRELLEIEKEENTATSQIRKEEKFMDNYVCLSLRRQELDGGVNGHLQLPPSDILLKSFYALMQDPLTPIPIRFALMTGLTTKPGEFPTAPLQKYRTCHTKAQRDIWLKTYSFHLPLCTELSDAEIYSKSRTHLMLLLMLIELSGLKPEKTASLYPADFLEAIKCLIVPDPEDLCKLPLNMIPVTTRNGDKEIATYGNMFALSAGRGYDETWGSPGVGLHTEMFGMESHPSQVFANLLATVPAPVFSSSSKNGRVTSLAMHETRKIAQGFCDRMLTDVSCEPEI